MTVIQVRGTSGSGKSTVMREVMEALPGWVGVHETGRKKPLYYSNHGLIVLGHYESQCGGCDTIGSARAVYELTAKLLTPDPSRIILQEGLLLSEDTKWTLQMYDARVLFLTTTLETCLERVEKRRLEAGNDKPLNPNNTANRVAVIERGRVKLSEAGVYCRRASSGQAASVVLRWVEESQAAR